MRFLWAFMGAMLISPRLLTYDLAPLVIPAIVFLIDMVARRGIGFWVSLVGLIAGASMVKIHYAEWEGLIDLTAIWAGYGLDQLVMSREPSSAAHAAPAPG